MARKTMAQVIQETLAAEGFSSTVHIGRKHVKVRWEVDSQPFTYSCAKSPGDWRAAENCRCNIRRILRAAGVDL